MNILVFHNLEHLTRSRANATDYLFCFERYAGHHNYLYHRIMLPIPEAIRQFPFDAVIFDSTALGIITLRPRAVFHEFKEALAFLTASPAVKLAFPQDDYHHSAILDEWLFDLRCDAIFTPLIEFRDLFYPRSSRQAEFFGVLTGYVDDRRIAAQRLFAKPWRARSRRIVQRVTLYPPWGGRFARIKGETAEMVKRAALARGLDGIDISTDPQDVLVGDDWFRLLGDAKFCLGAESGVSLWDRDGDILDRTQAYAAAHPDAPFEEVEAACFPGLDRRQPFAAVSPRLFEATLLQCCQILVEGRYLPELKPYEHYIPLAADGSNLEEVFALVADEAAAERRAAAAHAALIDNPEYRYSRLVAQVMGYIEGKARARRRAAADFAEMRRSYRRELIAAVSNRERAGGSRGEALVARVTSLLSDQFAEPCFAMADAARLLGELVHELAAARAGAEAQSGQINALERENRELSEQNRALAARVAGLEAQSGRIDALEREKHGLSEQNHGLSEQNHGLSEQNRALIARITAAEARLANALEFPALPEAQRELVRSYMRFAERRAGQSPDLPFHVRLAAAMLRAKRAVRARRLERQL